MKTGGVVTGMATTDNTRPLAISVSIARLRGAPRAPSGAALARLFGRAWKLADSARRPKLRGNRRAAVDVHFVDDARIAELNELHLQHSGPTDVLSFPMREADPERGAFNLGEIVVSFETAAREAAGRNIQYEDELARYCVHGFLHLLGYEDKTPAQRRRMFRIQERVLKSA